MNELNFVAVVSALDVGIVCAYNDLGTELLCVYILPG